MGEGRGEGGIEQMDRQMFLPGVGLGVGCWSVLVGVVGGLMVVWELFVCVVNCLFVHFGCGWVVCECCGNLVVS